VWSNLVSRNVLRAGVKRKHTFGKIDGVRAFLYRNRIRSRRSATCTRILATPFLIKRLRLRSRSGHGRSVLRWDHFDSQ